MELVLVGINHKTAPVEIRERLAFGDESLPSALRRLCTEFQMDEGMIVSTCNRVEIIAHGQGSQSNTVESIKRFLYSYHSLESSSLEQYLYSYARHDVVRHVFRVASSLDSMVIGEAQILAQMKQAYAAARQVESAGKYLRDLIPRAFFVAKRVRTSTRVGSSAVSVSSVAVELARKIFGDLCDHSVFLLGAGEMAELAAQKLLQSGVKRIQIANRTPERSLQLATQLGGEAIPFDDVPAQLIQSDIVLVSTGADTYVLQRDLMEQVIRRRKYEPLFVIDISVPRNVEPAVNEIENVFLYDIDDLQSVVDANMRERHREAEAAEEIVDQEVRKYVHQMSVRNVGPVVGALRERIEGAFLDELERNKNGLEPADYERLRKVVRLTAHRIAHPLIAAIKEPDDDPARRLDKVEWIRKIFRLEDDE